jgi:hypothetical protein
MAQDVEVIVRVLSPGALRPQYSGVGPGTRQLQGLDATEGEVARFGGYMSNDAGVATLLTAINTAVAVDCAVFR